MNKKTAPLDNLPAQVPPLHGREGEASKIAQWLKQCRVVTLLGPEGSGKSTLALYVASNFFNDFPNGTFHIRLSHISRPEALFQAILQALEISESPRHSLFDTLKAELYSRKALLILDDFEQVSGAASLVNDLVRTTQFVRFLIVSRDLVAFPPGMMMVLPPARTSGRGGTGTGLGQYAQQFSAVNFLVSRLQAMTPDFALTDANATNILVLCAQFGSIPIATDLIAIQTKNISPQKALEQLLAKLETDLACPAALSSDQLLQTLLEWIDSLLSPDESTCLYQLAIFAGDFRAEAAQEICQSESLSAKQIQECLPGLIQRGLLRLDESRPEHKRYFLLEPVREYALKHLNRQQNAAALCRRHTEYYTRMAEQAEPELISESQLEWMKLLEAEYPNLRAAMLWSIENAETELALRLTGALYRYWNRRSYFSEGLTWLEKAIALPGEVSLRLRIKAERCAGSLSRIQNDVVGAEHHFSESLRLARLVGDQSLIAQSLNGMAIMAHEQHDLAQARAYYEEGLALARLSNNQVATCNLLANLALLAEVEGRYEDAEAHFKEALEIERERGDTLGAAGVQLNWANMNVERGDLEKANGMVKEAIAFLRGQESLDFTSTLLFLQGDVDYYRGNLTTARQKFTKALNINQSLGGKIPILDCLTRLGAVANDLGEYATARRHFEEAIGVAESLGSGADLTNLLDAVGSFALSRQHFSEAAYLYAAAEAQRTQIGEVYPPISLPRYEQNLKMVRTQLGETKFQTHWATGQKLTMTECLALMRSIE